MNIPAVIQQQKNFFATQKTKDVSFRKKVLQNLLTEVQRREKDIIDAL